MPSEPFGILLLTGTHERAHYAFMLAAGAAALGRPVVLFASNDGCRALLADWRGLQDAQREERALACGVAGLAELREAAREMGVRLIACEAGLRLAALDPALLAPGVEVAGIASFLAATSGGQVISL